MTYPVKSYAARSPTAPLAPFALRRRTPRPDDVVIDILFCGVCHSDLHNVRNDWGNGWSSRRIRCGRVMRFAPWCANSPAPARCRTTPSA